MPKPAKKVSNAVATLRARLALHEPKILKVIGEESKNNRTDKISSSQINRVVKAARAKK